MRNHTYDDDLVGKLWVSIRPFAMQDPEKEISVITKEDTRFYHCNIKTLNLLPSVMASQDAKKAGVGETVFHRGEIVTECSHSNISILKDGVFISHPNDNMILRGIAKTHMIAACLWMQMRSSSPPPPTSTAMPLRWMGWLPAEKTRRREGFSRRP